MLRKAKEKEQQQRQEKEKELEHGFNPRPSKYMDLDQVLDQLQVQGNTRVHTNVLTQIHTCLYCR